MTKVNPGMALLRQAVHREGGMPEAMGPNETHWGSQEVGRHYEARGNLRDKVAVWQCDFLGWMDPDDAARLP